MKMTIDRLLIPLNVAAFREQFNESNLSAEETVNTGEANPAAEDGANAETNVYVKFV